MRGGSCVDLWNKPAKCSEKSRSQDAVSRRVKEQKTATKLHTGPLFMKPMIHDKLAWYEVSILEVLSQGKPWDLSGKEDTKRATSTPLSSKGNWEAHKTCTLAHAFQGLSKVEISRLPSLRRLLFPRRPTFS